MTRRDGHNGSDHCAARTRPAIDPEEDSSSLHDRLASIGAEALAETLDLLLAGRLVPEKQDDALTCYAPMLKKDDGLVDWSKEPQQIRNLVRGMTPWPGAFSFVDGHMVKIYQVRTAAGEGVPGTVIHAGREGLEVACAGGSIIVEELQLEGKKRLPARDFLAGYKIAPGTILGKRIELDR